jgi:hypothetical protein
MDDPQHQRPALAGRLVVLVAEHEVMIGNIVRIALDSVSFLRKPFGGGRA